MLWTAALIARVCGTVGLDMVSLGDQTTAWGQQNRDLASGLAARDTRALTVLWLSLFTLACIVAGLVALAGWSHADVIVAFSIACGVSAMQRLWTVQLIAQGRTQVGQSIESIILPLGAIVGAILCAVYAPEALLWSQVLAFTFAALITLIVAPKRRTNMQLPRIEWLRAMPVAAGAALTALSVRLPIFVLGSVSISAAGVFDVSQRVQSAGSLGVSAVATALLPSLSQAATELDRKRLWIQVLVGACLAALIPTALLIGLLWAGPDIFVVALGPAYVDAWLPGVLLVAAALVNASTSAVSNLLSITGFGRYFAWISALQLATMVLCFYLVQPDAISAALIVLCVEIERSSLLMLSALQLFGRRRVR